MKKRKVLIITFFIFFAFPIPISLISWVGTIISVASIGMADLSNFREMIQVSVALITMLLAGTYLITYIIALLVTLKKKAISLISFLPLFHIMLFIISIVVWIWLNAIYKV